MPDSNPTKNTIPEMFLSAARQYGDRIAYVFEETKQYGMRSEITFSEIKDQAQNFAKKCGGTKNNIAIISENRPEFCAAFFGIILSGNIAVPIDGGQSEEEISRLISFADVKTVFASDKYYKKVSSVENAEIIRLEFEKNLNSQSSEADELPEISESDTAEIIFTSGTWGTPKAVELSHENICFDIIQAKKRCRINKEDVFWSVLPLYHTYGNVCGMLCPFFSGATVLFKNSPADAAGTIEDNKVSVALCVPSMLELVHRKLSSSVWTGKTEFEVPKTLRLIICGAGGLSSVAYKWFNKRIARTVQGYGMTECSPIVALEAADGEPCVHSCGKLLDGIDATVKNVGEDGFGELYVSGKNVTKGYYKNPEATDSAFYTDENGTRYLKTGDMGLIDENGFVYISGNIKNVIVAKNGKNIYPEELEAMLRARLFIKEAQIAGVENADGEITIKAEIYPDFKAIISAFKSGELGSDDADAAVRADVNSINSENPSYKQISEIVIRKRPFSKTSTGKITKNRQKNS